jgi:hypothetical protein
MGTISYIRNIKIKVKEEGIAIRNGLYWILKGNKSVLLWTRLLNIGFIQKWAFWLAEYKIQKLTQ